MGLSESDQKKLMDDMHAMTKDFFFLNNRELIIDELISDFVRQIIDILNKNSMGGTQEELDYTVITLVVSFLTPMMTQIINNKAYLLKLKRQQTEKLLKTYESN